MNTLIYKAKMPPVAISFLSVSEIVCPFLKEILFLLPAPSLRVAHTPCLCLSDLAVFQGDISCPKSAVRHS